MMPLLAETDVRAVLPTIRVPTLVLHHTDDPFFPPEWGKDVADRIPGAKYVQLPGRNMFHFVEPDWRASFQEIAEFVTGHRAGVADDRVLATGSSLTSWIRRGAQQRSATATGIHCLTRTTPSCAHSSHAIGAVR
jgi:hypothetical protein